MRRGLNVVLVVLTICVVAAAVYVVGHHDPVPGAGTVPTDSAAGSALDPTSLLPSTSSSPSISSTSSGSRAPTTSTSSGSSSVSTTSTGRSTSTSAPTDTLRAAFVGDNYTAGEGATSAAKGWAPLVADRLHLSGKQFAVSGGGYAKPGADGDTYLGLVAAVAAYAPDVVIVSGGRNDSVDDQQTLTDAAMQLFASLRAKLPRATIVAIAPWWGDSPHPEQLTPVDDAVRAGVVAVKGTYLDLDDPLVGHPGYMADDANPNDSGYAHIATAVAAALQAKHLVG